MLTEDERAAIDRAVNELLVVYHGDDHVLIRAKIDQLNEATQTLAEIMMNYGGGQGAQGDQNR